MIKVELNYFQKPVNKINFVLTHKNKGADCEAVAK